MNTDNQNQQHRESGNAPTAPKPKRGRGRPSLKRARLEEQREQLRKILTPGTKVYTILRSVSRSGMCRHISLLVWGKDGPINITYAVGVALSIPITDKNGHTALRVTGCGMDMGYHLVQNLSYALHGGPKDVEDAGYSLRHDWL